MKLIYNPLDLFELIHKDIEKYIPHLDQKLVEYYIDENRGVEVIIEVD